MITKKQLVFIILRDMVIAIVVAGIALSIVIYSANHISEMSDTISQKKKISFALEKRSETYSNLKKDFATFGAADSIMERALIPSDDISDFISALENLGVKNGVNQAYQFGRAVPPDEPGNLPVSSIDYSIKVKTPIKNFISYLRDFENMPYFSGILNVSIVAGGEDGIRGISDVSLNARLYTKQNI